MVRVLEMASMTDHMLRRASGSMPVEGYNGDRREEEEGGGRRRDEYTDTTHNITQYTHSTQHTPLKLTSSKKRTFGSPTSATARLSLRLLPPLYVPQGRAACLERPTWRTSRSTRSRSTSSSMPRMRLCCVVLCCVVLCCVVMMCCVFGVVLCCSVCLVCLVCGD